MKKLSSPTPILKENKKDSIIGKKKKKNSFQKLKKIGRMIEALVWYLFFFFFFLKIKFFF